MPRAFISSFSLRNHVFRSIIFETKRPLSFTAWKKSTANDKEVDFFRKLSHEWWRPDGEFQYLHRMNFVRSKFLYELLIPHVDLDKKEGALWLQDLSVLDVGCGGGMFTETLARLGPSNIMGIDAVPENIKVAQQHKSYDPRLTNLEYKQILAEDLVAAGATYDIVTSMDVIEHVDKAPLFLDSLCDLVKPGGFLMLSTISRTPLADLVTIQMAENILHLVSKGTHHYEKFIKPSELETFFIKDKKWGPPTIAGTCYNPLFQKWHLFEPGQFMGFFENVNYFIGIQKPLA